MTGPGTEGCLTPSLCLFTRLATNGCVALNKTRARWPRSRAGSLYPGIDFSHTRSCSRFPSAIVTGLCGAPQATGCQRLPAAAQCIARRNTMGRLKLEVPRGPGAAPHSAVSEGTLPASEAGRRAGVLAAVQPFAQTQAHVVSRVTDQAERDHLGGPRAMQCVTEQCGGAGGSRGEGLARGDKPLLDKAGDCCQSPSCY